MLRPATVERRLQLIAQALFFASGVVALLYQVIWQRLLGFVTGLDLYSVTLTVAMFMLGMGVGSFVGGWIADRWPPRRLFLVFAAAECVVAAFALLSSPLYHDMLYQAPVGANVPAGLFAALAASTLLLPTFCMGVTLPVLSRALSASVATAPDRIAGLYGWNTLGAAAGAWAGSAWLVRSLGYEHSLWVGALVNLGCAAAAVLCLRAPAGSARSRAEEGAEREEPRVEASLPLWSSVYCISGFIALGLEMVWFRILGVVLKSTAFTFPLLLGFYLGGVGAGSLLGRRLAGRTLHPLRWFLLLQAAIPLYAALSVGTLVWGLGALERLAGVRDYLASYEPIGFSFNFFSLSRSQLALYLTAPVVLILPPTILMGASFSLLQRGIQSDIGHVGRRVGTLQTANIIGSTAGVCLVGLVWIDRFGTTGTLQALAALSVVFLVLAAANVLATAPRLVRWSGAAATLGVAALGVAIVPHGAELWSWLHGVPPARIIHDEDGTGLAALTNESPEFDGRTSVYVNGLGQSTIPFGGIHSFLGLAPVLLHPEPLRVAIIGLGSGDTAYSAASRPEMQRLDCVEIISGQIRTLRKLHDRAPHVGVGALLDDPRIEFVSGDGRRYLMQARTRYDVIEADALRPTSAYAGNLYSREYFELLRSRLTPGGFAVTWAPTARIDRTFTSVFPHVVEIKPMLIGSNEPIVLDADAVRARARDPRTSEHYRRVGIDLEQQVERLLRTMRRRDARDGASDTAQLNTDLFPRDELRLQ